MKQIYLKNFRPQNIFKNGDQCPIFFQFKGLNQNYKKIPKTHPESFRVIALKL